MRLFEILLLFVGAIALAFLLITIVRRISSFYRQRYNMSVWAGVFMLVIAIILTIFSIYHSEKLNVLSIVFALAFLLITAILDIHHAGIGMGLLALLFQVFLSVTFIVVVIAAVIYFILSRLRRGDDILVDTLTGTTSGFRNGVRLFFSFFRP